MAAFPRLLFPMSLPYLSLSLPKRMDPANLTPFHDFCLLFLSIILEGAPFILLGTLISGFRDPERTSRGHLTRLRMCRRSGDPETDPQRIADLLRDHLHALGPYHQPHRGGEHDEGLFHLIGTVLSS